MANRYAERALQQVRGTPTPTSAPAPRSTLGRSAINSVRPTPAPVEPEEDKSWVEKYAPTIARIGLPLLGAGIGSVVPVAGTAAGAGIGAAIGGAIGGGLGEVAAEKLEGRELSPKEIALSTGLSAIPAGPAGRVAGALATPAKQAAAMLAKDAALEAGKRELGSLAKFGLRTAVAQEGRTAANVASRAALHAAEGAAQGALAETVSPFVREGRAPTMEEIGRGAAFGTVLGGALGTGADLAGNALFRRPVDVPPVEAPPPVVDAPPAGLRRPAFLDEGLDPDLPPGPELGYGRGGVPVEPVPPPPIPAEWEGAPPPEFAPADVIMPRTPAEVAADQLRAKGIPETWRTVRRPDELLSDVAPLPDLGPSPSAGFARGGRPVEKTPPLVTEQPLQEPGVAFTEQTPLPRDGDRRQIVAPVTGFERRLAQRRSEYAQKWGLPEEHPAVVDFMAAHTEARTDALTSLPNKRAWMEDLLPSVRPEDHVVVVDMSKLKPINDKLGHGAGDTAIKTFSGVVAEVFGKEAARIGGDELAAVLRNVNREQAEAIVEKFRQAAANRPTKLRNAKTGETVDIPGYEAHIGVGKSFDEADAAANAAAEASRKGGRGDVPVVPGEPDPSGNPPVPATPAPPVAGLGDRPGVAPGGAAPDPPQTTVPKRFDREAAIARLYSRGAQANDLGSAAAQGAGVLQDLAEIGASYVEEYAQRNKGKLVAFDSWARAAFKALKDVVPNVRKYLRQIYDEAVGLWNKTGVTFGSLPNEPRGVVLGSLGGALQPPGGGPSMPPPKMPKVKTPVPTSPQPLPPGTVIKPTQPRTVAPEPIRTEVTGRPVQPAEAPRVEARVDELRVAEKEAGEVPAMLDRETRQRWEDLDKPVQKILREYDDDRFFSIMKQRNLDAAETMAWDARIKGKGERLEELRAKIRDNPADDVARRDLVAADLDFIAAQRANVNDGTGLARALAARARVMEASRQPNDQFLKKVFRELPNVTDKQAAEMIEAFRENPDNLQPLLHAAVGHGMVQKALELWKANMLSAFSTDIANFSGNVIEHHMQLAQTATTGIVDSVLQRIYGGNRARFAGEFGAEWAGGNRALGPALKNLGRNFIKTVVKGQRKPIDLSRRLEYQTSALSSKGLGQYTSRVFGKLEIVDEFFKEWGGGAELDKLAYRKASKGGGSQEQIRRRAAEIVQQIADPANSDHSEILRAVAAAKERRAFQERRHGSLTESLDQLVRRHPLLNFPLPFRRTPGNIAARIIERSPLGAKRAMQAFNAFKEAQRGFEAGSVSADDFAEARGLLADAIAGPLMGTALLGGFAALAASGAMTGGGPTDPKDKNALRDSGWSPYSFVLTIPTTGKKMYVPYNRFEPVSSLLGFAADIVEARDSKTAGDLFDKGLGSFTSNMLDKSFYQGLGNTGEFLSNPKQHGGAYVRGLAGSMLVPNMVGRLASAIDPKFRDTRPESDGPLGIVEAAGKTVMSRIPGVSTLLPERRGGTGESIERPGNAVSRFLAPAIPTTEKEGGDFNRFLVDIDAVPSAPGRDLVVKGKRVRLSEEEYRAIQDADEKTTASLRRSLPKLMKTDPEKARNVIRSAYDQARATARRRVMVSPGFRTRAREVAK